MYLQSLFFDCHNLYGIHSSWVARMLFGRFTAQERYLFVQGKVSYYVFNDSQVFMKPNAYQHYSLPSVDMFPDHQ